MPIETDSGFLPDWLKAILSQQSGASGGGLFSGGDVPAPQNIGLLAGGPPAFTSVNPSAPAFQGENAPNGPLPDQPATFSYLNPRPPWGGSGPSNSYPSMAFPQDPGPMNVGPSGAAPLFGGVRPDAPFMANGPTAVQDQYANVPLPPRRPNDLTSFQAMAPAGAPQEINTPPAGQPNSNVVGTAASGAPEITAQKAQGLGDYLGKAANLVGGIYGAGGPGDALIALGLSNRTNGASIQALNSMNANRVSQTNLALKQYDLATKQRRESSTYKYLIGKGADPAVAAAAVDNPELMKSLVQQNEGVDQWVKGGTDRYGNPIVFRKDDPTKTMVLGGGSDGGATPGSASTNLTGEDYLATLPDRDRNVVQMIHEGRAPYPNAMSNRSPEATRIRDMVTKAYPDTDASQYKAREALRKDFEAGTAPNSAGNVITTGNTVLGHLGRFSDAAEALNNGNIPAFNAVRQTFGKAFGGAENVTDFNGMKNRVVEELTRFYRGAGGAEKDIQRELQALSESQSPTQLRRSIAAQADAIESKISALQHKWKTGMPDQPDYPIFNEEGKAALDKINSRRFMTGGPDTGGSAPATAAPVAAAPAAPAQKKRFKYNPETGALE